MHMACTTQQVACIVTVIILSVVFIAKCDQSMDPPNKSDCSCYPVPKLFNETIIDRVNNNCRKCYFFSYNFTLQQDWAANICVYSPNVSHLNPLLIVVREHLSVMSFQVPQRFEERSSFNQVCHTLCPSIAKFFHNQLKPSIQNIFLEITTRSPTPVEFEVTLSIDDTFIIVEEQSMTVNITPSQPRVLQYNMDKSVSAVRVEAQSPDDSCMVLAIQGMQCPFYDSQETVENAGLYQTLTKQSGIDITKHTFPMGRVYIVLILKPTNAECIECCEGEEKYQFSKQVTVTIVPDEEHIDAVYWPLGLYVGIFVVALLICSCFIIGALKKCCQKVHLQSFCCNKRNCTGYETVEMGSAEDVETGGIKSDTQRLLYVADLAKKEDEDLNSTSKAYSWNILSIAIFYGLVVVQLAYINQGIVNLTGNQDVCYYNYLCSRELWGLTDFNHVYSNIGYVILGPLFLFLVYRRESLHTEFMEERKKNGRTQTGTQGYQEGEAVGANADKPGFSGDTHLLVPGNSDEEPKVQFRKDVAFDKPKNVLVQFCAPLPFYHEHLALIYDKLDEKYRNNPNVAIDKIDITANELAEHTKIGSYLAIKLSITDTDEVVTFNGEPTVEAISWFIESGGVDKEEFQKVGIPPHFGLFYAMGWALTMEGVLSGSYHACPNKANFQFDTSFMYVIATVCMLKLYQARHPDISPRSHTTYMILAIFVIIGAGELLKRDNVIWLLFVIAHLTVIFLASVLLYYNGCCCADTAVQKRLLGSRTPNWQPLNYQEFFRRCSWPPKCKGRFFGIGVVVLVNIAVDLTGFIMQPQSFADFILALFIGNLFIYLIYYMRMKVKAGENILRIPIMLYGFLSIILWVFAVVFFKFYHITDWEDTPAKSRERNRHCMILNFFDSHDIWHFLSSCALFTSFMLLLTLDDDLKEKPRSEIVVF